MVIPNIYHALSFLACGEFISRAKAHAPPRLLPHNTSYWVERRASSVPFARLMVHSTEQALCMFNVEHVNSHHV